MCVHYLFWFLIKSYTIESVVIAYCFSRITKAETI